MSLFPTWMQNFVYRCVSRSAKLHQRLGTTIIYVTHDQTEAMTLGTRIVVMKDGVVQQVDTPQNLYDETKQPVRCWIHRISSDELP